MKKLLLIALLFITATSFGQIIIKQSNKVNFYETIYIGTAGATPNDTSNAAMVVRQLGNVGIGTASPSGKLDVKNGGYRTGSYPSGVFSADSLTGMLHLPTSSFNYIGSGVNFVGYFNPVSLAQLGFNRTGAAAEIGYRPSVASPNNKLSIDLDTTNKIINHYGMKNDASAFVRYWNSSNVNTVTLYNNGNLGVGTTAPAAILDVTSTTSAFLPPRMTEAQRDLIATPVNGMVLYNSTTNKLQVRAAGAWVDLH